MKKGQLIEAIEKGCFSDELTIDEVLSIVERYPYAAVVQKIALKLLYSDGDVRYDEHLPLVAAVVRSRKKLYEFIHQSTNKDLTVCEETEKDSIQEESDADHSLVANNKRRSGLRVDYFEDVSYSTQVYALTEETREVVKESDSGARTFSDWLKFMESQKEASPSEEVGLSDNGDEKWNLIDNFIKEQPEIKPPNTKDQVKLSRQEIEQSNQETEEFMTETLAQIYIKQKHYEKAIRIFEKLSLKYPEKNTYFAGQIKLIGQLKNNEKE